MQVIILAAGYATRLYPLTKDQPKPLLPIAGRPILEHILDSLSGASEVEKVLIVTNNKFYGHFNRWAAVYSPNCPYAIEIINDQSTSDDDKLGAIGDLHLVITKLKITSDLMVVAGDNLFEKSIVPFIKFARENHSPVLGICDVGSFETIKKFSAVTLDEDKVITHFEEKPANPETTLAGIALYYYPAETVSLVHTYITMGNNPDQPGRFIQWLHTRMPVMGWLLDGGWYDIGSHETLAEADKIFTEKADAKGK